MTDDREASGTPEEVEELGEGGAPGAEPVKQEAAAADVQGSAQEGGAEDGTPPGPPPDIYGVLRFCLGLVIEQAWVHLGLHLAPGMTETQMDLPRARVAIDCAASIYEYLKPDADEQKQRATELALANLRVNFAKKAGQ